MENELIKIAKEKALGVYLSNISDALMYDEFMGLQNLDNAKFSLVEAYETYDLRDMQDLIEAEYDAQLRCFDKLLKLSKKVSVTKNESTVNMDPLEATFVVCPACKSTEIDFGMPDVETYTLKRMHVCEDCGCEWQEIYALRKVIIQEKAHE
jgi:hypothetical protein